MLTKEFVLAGRALFTLDVPEEWRRRHHSEANPTRPHFTYKVTRKPRSDWYFVSAREGSDYAYLGTLDSQTGQVRIAKNSAFNEDEWAVRLIRRALPYVWAGNLTPLHEAGFDLHHEGKCGRCGRELTDPDSISRGLGPDCLKKSSLVPA